MARSKQSSKRSAKKAAPKVSKTTATPRPKTSNAWRLMITGWSLLAKYWRFYAIFCLVLAVLNIILVHNFSADVSSLKSQVNQSFGISNAALTTAGTYFLLVGNSSGVNSAASIYQYILLVVGSLAVIWSLRQFMSDKPPARLRVRDSFYEGLYPIAQFVLVLVVLAIELLPLVFGSSLYALIITNGIAISIWEQTIWLVVFLALATVSIWLVVRSMLAIYITTLPAMTPVEALRQASRISKGYRFSIIRKSLFLGVALFAISIILVVPAIAVFPPIAQYVLFSVGIISLPLTHAYLYTFYREIVG